MMHKRFFLVFGLLALSACSGVDILNAIVPRDGYTVHHDIAYAPGDRQKLDIYIPDTLATGQPALVFFYGGSWQTGRKEDYLFVGQALASRGIIAVIADYQLYPPAYFPDFINDAAQAFVWTHTNIASYGGNPGLLFLGGHSAGAYNAVMLAVNDRYITGAGGKMAWIRGTIGIAGPYDFLPLVNPQLIELFRKVDSAETQPINFVHAGLAPMLLACGDKDEDVLPQNSFHMQSKLRRFSDAVELDVYPGVGHTGIILSMAQEFRDTTPLLNDISRFIDVISGAESASAVLPAAADSLGFRPAASDSLPPEPSQALHSRSNVGPEY
jgi:acetyl esterase/lipase